MDTLHLLLDWFDNNLMLLTGLWIASNICFAIVKIRKLNKRNLR